MATNGNYVPEVNFATLVLTLSSSAWVGLGKIADPISGEVKKDLKGAKYTINVLLMLREKTKGNLNTEEEKVLNGIISELQANYAGTVFAGDHDDQDHDDQDHDDQEEPSTDSRTTSSAEEKLSESKKTEVNKENDKK